MSKKGKGVFKFLTGVTLGAGLGMLFAPKKGSETRKELKLKFDELITKAKEIDVTEVKDNIENKINEIKLQLEDLDKEKALSSAKKTAKKIEAKAEELVSYAIEKGTPALEKVANQAREKTIEVIKQVLTKLEKEN